MRQWVPTVVLVGILSVWTAGCSNGSADDSSGSGSDTKSQPAEDGSQSKQEQQEPGSGTY